MGHKLRNWKDINRKLLKIRLNMQNTMSIRHYGMYSGLGRGAEEVRTVKKNKNVGVSCTMCCITAHERHMNDMSQAASHPHRTKNLSFMCVNEIFHRGGKRTQPNARTHSLARSGRQKLTGRMETTRRRLSFFFSSPLSP